MKACVWCAESIQDEARICRFCSREQTQASAEVLFEGRSTPARWLIRLGFVAIAAVVVTIVLFRQLRDLREEYLSFMGLAIAAVAIAFATFEVVRLVAVRTKLYRVTTLRVQVEQGVFSKRVSSVDLWRVRDVVLTQTLVQLVVRAGDLSLVSSDEVAPTLLLRDLPRARVLYDKLKDAVDRARRDGKVVALDSRG